MHADALAHLGAGERAEGLDTLFEEILLAIDDDVGDPADGLPSLVDVVDEELGTRDVLPNVLALVVGHRRRRGARASRCLELTNELAVDRIHSQ